MEPEGRKNDAMLNRARNADDIGRQHILLCDDGDGGKGDTSEGMGIGTISFSGCASGTPAGNDATPSVDQISVSRNSALFPTFRNLKLKQTKLLGRARRVLREKNDDSTGSDESLEVSSQGAGPEHEELFHDERGQKSERDELLLGRSSILDSEISLISGAMKGTRTGSESGPIHVGNLSKVKGDEPDGLDSSNPNAFAEIKEGFQALHDLRKQQNGIVRLGVTRTAEVRNLGNEGHSTNLDCKHVSLEVSVNESGILSHVHTELEGSSNESKLNPENLNNDSIKSCMVSTDHAIHDDSMNLDSKRFLHSSSHGTRHHVATSGTSVKPASKHVSFATREVSLQQSCTQDSDVEKKPDINGKPESPLLVGSSLTKNEGKVSSKVGDPQLRKPRESNNFVWVNCKRYQKLGKIGSGGSSEVFKVIAQDCTIYALKRINLKGRDHQTACGFHQEIEYLQLLQNKSHIIQLVDYEVTDKTVFDKDGVSNGEILADVYIYMVLEYGEIDLAHMLERKKRELSMANEQLDENWLRLYWEHILKAVNTIHEERIVHADLKPANFLLVQGVLKLIDFGIAKAIQNDTTNIVREAQVGTVNYMSPEAFMMNGHDEHLSVKCGRPSDIWSLGCILYQMVYGRTPFSHLNFIQRIREITNPLHEISFPEVANPLLLDIIKKCLVWDKNKRPRIPELLEHPFLRPQLSNVLSCSSNQCLENFLLASWKLYLSTVGTARFKLIVGKVVTTPAASLDIEPQLESVLIEMSKRYISEAGLSKFELLLGSFTDVATEY